jgi:hypothetical protein
MADNEEITQLLPPSTAVRIAWALTGSFSTKNQESIEISIEAKKNLDDIKRRAQDKGDLELNYVTNAAIDVASTMRTLDTIYKGRELNISENDKLRNVNLENIQDSMQFGNKAKDVIKSIPTMAITTGTGTIALYQILDPLNLPNWSTWLIGLGMAGIGYLVYLVSIRISRVNQQKLFVKQDFERDLFYSQYITRVRTALIYLYNDIDRLHFNAFKKSYPLGESENAMTVVDGILKGAQPTMCKKVYEHMKSGIISIDMWPSCESGGNAIESCKYNK